MEANKKGVKKCIKEKLKISGVLMGGIQNVYKLNLLAAHEREPCTARKERENHSNWKKESGF